ncbi:uncharacterized protein K460DRAFT_55538 [Cucurbitaria berberidis CBS 394.84]|uniref:Uncharacterized protein n=1 Tax=Cucurbitaria berberidis CBS 394.84 TaxID=1168544 RepID=A0A9P4LAI0_9PLEO|nr:uncharacterized protein K460DRAFT_55538 [Cucurbitaria berberidis CBS 394.84]KAF1847219.1 hypothetical protein K460DRAFT_55538 [Cucurbitaria berberidis CBS 394.84]
MAKLAANAMTNHQDEPAFWELFGPRAVSNLTSIQNTFKASAEFTKKIITTCNLDDTHPTCTDRFNYGGIGALNSTAGKRDDNISLVFCREFFGFPPLDYKINMGINNPDDQTARFNLGYYHENQGTALLRAILPFALPSNEAHISDLWVNIHHQNTPKWTACYGVLCSKILARLDGSCWSVLNADNYALFALSKYISQVIEGSFPWLPRLERNEPSWSPLIVTNLGGIQGGAVAVTEKFSENTVSQPRYNKSRYQLDLGTYNPRDRLGNSAVDLSNSSWLQQESSYPEGWHKQRNDFLQEWTSAWDNVSLNMDTKRTHVCFKNGNNASTPYGSIDSQPFDATEAAELALKFCNETVRQWMKITVYPSVLTAAKKAIDLSVWHQTGRKNSTNEMNFFWTADPNKFLSARAVGRLFEGRSDDDKIQHCHATYKYIMEQCDKDSPDKYGGYITLNDRIYAAFVTPASHRASRNNIAPMSTFKCAEYNATSYWRAAASIQSMQDTRLSKLCTCWYDDYTFAAEMFCRPAAGDCVTLVKEENRVWAKDRGYNCP